METEALIHKQNIWNLQMMAIRNAPQWVRKDRENPRPLGATHEDSWYDI